jgi:tryptophan synthase beta subunit
MPAIEPAHAIYHAAKMAADLPADKIIIINLSGRGDKDLDIITGVKG